MQFFSLCENKKVFSFQPVIIPQVGSMLQLLLIVSVLTSVAFGSAIPAGIFFSFPSHPT
jgi:H+/Cl- antiporter ClcA